MREELILIEKTKEEFGYEPSSLKNGSNKFIWHKCPICGEPKKSKYAAFVLDTRLVHSGDCRQKLILQRNDGIHPFQKEEVKNKIAKTINNKYGGHHSKTKEIKDKKIKTMQERYGVENPGQLKSHIEKMEQSNLEKFNVKYPMQSDEIKKKSKEASIEHYGVSHPMLSDIVKEKVVLTNIIKYGTENPMQCEAIKEKAAKTNLEKYGVSTYLLTIESREKMREEMISRGETKEFWLEQTFDECKLNPNQDFPERWLAGSHQQFEVICSCGKIWKPIFYDFTSGKNRSCGHNHSTSYAEQEIYNFIKDELKVGCENRYTENNKEFDIYIESKKVAIEFNGLVWHGEKFSKDVLKDYKKYLYCKEKGIRYIGIFEDEWTENSDRIKSFLRHILGEVKAKYTIRPQKLKIVFEESIEKDTIEFLSKHHYLTPNPSSKYIWKCFSEDTLVGVMCIGQPTRQGTIEDYELKRVCGHPDYKCYGLWSYLLKNYVKPKLGECVITSFSDNRRDTGDLYKKLGFTEVKKIRPDYWWCKGDKRKHKSSFRKTEDEKLTGLTERELRHAQGMFRVWDCGKTKWNLVID